MSAIERIAAAIANGKLESQHEQTCRHERQSIGGGMSGFCLGCGADVMVEQVEEWLANHPPKGSPSNDD